MTATVDPDRYRDALAHWASGVAVVAVRDETQVLATTVTALLSVSIDPPMLLFSLGRSAQVLPFLAPYTTFAVSLLAETQGRLGTVFADSFPMGGPPFPVEGVPFVEGALVQLSCRVNRLEAAGDHQLVLAFVDDAQVAPGRPLIRYQRGYRRLAEE